MDSVAAAGASPPSVLIQNVGVPAANVRHRQLTVRILQPQIVLGTVQASSIRATTAPSTASAFASLPASASPSIGPPKPEELQDVTIIGGGIAGLATALGLHRLGIRPLVLERSEQLQTAGSAIGIWTNAWKALDALGVADGLRKKFDRLTGLEFYTKDGKFLASMSLQDPERDVEFRAIDRKTLLEALRQDLPDGIVFYDAQVMRIQKTGGGYTEVECKNGWKIKTKVLIGCDGVGSIVRKWMGFKQPQYAGYTAIRGLAAFPKGHNLKQVATQIIGEGVRAGIVTMDSNRAYWFVCFNCAVQEKVLASDLIRQEALKYVQGCPEVIKDVINHSPLHTFSRRAISDRWMWPMVGPGFYQGGVTLAGDAMHPLTPNLGQGGCCALEDAVVLARHLGKAFLVSAEPQPDRRSEMERIEIALQAYTEQRWPRMLPMAIRSYFIGAIMQLDNSVVCSARNALIPKLLNVDRFTSHTSYNCGTLLLEADQ